MEIDIKGMKTNYIKEGNGENIVLLHGWGSSIVVFKQTIELLKKTHTVYALDMPGCGLTEEPKKPMDAKEYAEFVLEFVQKVGIDRASFLGHSNGGRTIIKMASMENLPIKIDKLILVDSAGIKAKKSVKVRCKVAWFKLGKKLLNMGIVKKLYPEGLQKFKDKYGSEDYKNASPVMKE